MRTILTLTIGALLSLSSALHAQGESNAAKVRDLYRQGLLAMRQGQIETAQTCFQAVLQIQPNNMNAKYQLRQLSLQHDQFGAKRREMKMSTVYLPKVEFDEATLPEALDAINKVVQQETKGEFTPNFVIRDPEGVFEQRKLTLKLGRVPAAVALKYALENARATARYDEHAIVIRPLGTTTGTSETGDKEAEPAPRSKSGAPDPFAR